MCGKWTVSLFYLKSDHMEANKTLTFLLALGASLWMHSAFWAETARKAVQSWTCHFLHQHDSASQVPFVSAALAWNIFMTISSWYLLYPFMCGRCKAIPASPFSGNASLAAFSVLMDYSEIFTHSGSVYSLFFNSKMFLSD